MVDRWDAVTPFGNKGQEGKPPPPPEPWRYGCPAFCLAVNMRRLTSWSRSTGKMYIVALPWSTLFLLWSFQEVMRSYLICRVIRFVCHGILQQTYDFSTAPCKCLSGKSIPHYMSDPPYFHTDVGYNSDPYPPPITTTPVRVLQGV